MFHISVSVYTECSLDIAMFIDTLILPLKRENGTRMRSALFWDITRRRVVPLTALRCLYPPLSHPGSTLLAVITPTDCYPAVLSRFTL
jgi:hypothetical protein